MKKFLLSALMLFALCSVTWAQTIEVTDFAFNEHDLTALQPGTMVLDQNGDKCALIKIITTVKGFTFDVGSLGVMKTDDRHTGEIWVYVPYGINKITLSHPEYGQLRNFPIPMSIEKGRTYIMKLKTKRLENSNTLTLKYSPANGIVLIDGEMVMGTNGVVEKELSIGEHRYRILANGYDPIEGIAKINKDTPTNVGVQLIPNTPQVTSERKDVQDIINKLTFEDINNAHTKSAIYSARINGKNYFYATIPNHSNLAVIVAKKGAYKNFEEVVLPDTFQTNDGRIIHVIGIANEAFYKCKKIKKVVLPKSIRYVGNSAFKLCSIGVVNFNKGILGIGNNAFEGNLIMNIELPDGIKEIGDLSFSAYDPTFFTVKLKKTSRATNGKLYLPKSLEKIGKHAFGMSRNNLGTWWNSKRKILCLPDFIDVSNCKSYGISIEPVQEYFSK